MAFEEFLWLPFLPFFQQFKIQINDLQNENFNTDNYNLPITESAPNPHEIKNQKLTSSLSHAPFLKHCNISPVISMAELA